MTLIINDILLLFAKYRTCLSLPILYDNSINFGITTKKGIKISHTLFIATKKLV